MNAFRFPEGFRLGVSSAATQIDGGCENSNWYDWYKKGHIADNTDPSVATKHREFMKEDAEIMASLGIRDYRLGIEWARVEPEEGVFSANEFEKIREEIELLKSLGIRPLLTIHHFSNPMWFESRNGWLLPESKDIFLRLTRKVVEEVGDLVDEFVTVNEPNVYANNGFVAGIFPPGHKNMKEAFKVMDNMAAAHRAAYRLIHELKPSAKVGFALHMRVFTPVNNLNPWHRIAARMSDKIFQGDLVKKLLFEGNERFADFIGINYYTRTASRGLQDGVMPDCPKNDLGWEIFPEGIGLVAAKVNKLAPDLPIYITENGTADRNDAFRSRYIAEHLNAIARCGLPITRYYHWCFVDNWEWCEGLAAKFGIVAFDPETFERTVKKSGRFYAAVIRQGGISDEILREFVEPEKYKR